MSARIDLSRYPVESRSFSAPGKVELGEYVGTVPVTSEIPAYFYARLAPAQRLQVVWHGAVRAGVDSYPRFDRITSTRDSGDAFLALADPTVGVYPKVNLGWYLGGEGWDPIDAHRDLVLAAARATGAKEIVLVGGSGGGFAALRMALQIPSATAFVFNPQTAVLRYARSLVNSYFRYAYPSSTPERIAASEPARFDLSVAYAASHQHPRVYYAQNLSDSTHIIQHYLPFKRSLNVRTADGHSERGSIRFALYDGERDGHGPPTPHEYVRLLEAALEWGFEAIPADGVEPA